MVYETADITVKIAAVCRDNWRISRRICLGVTRSRYNVEPVLLRLGSDAGTEGDMRGRWNYDVSLHLRLAGSNLDTRERASVRQHGPITEGNARERTTLVPDNQTCNYPTTSRSGLWLIDAVRAFLNRRLDRRDRLWDSGVFQDGRVKSAFLGESVKFIHSRFPHVQCKSFKKCLMFRYIWKIRIFFKYLRCLDFKYFIVNMLCEDALFQFDAVSLTYLLSNIKKSRILILENWYSL